MSNRRVRDMVVNNIILPIGGANPVDAQFVQLKNVRGQLLISGTAADSGVTWSFRVNGNFYGTPDKNHNLDIASITNAVIESPAVNQFRITTDASDSGGRVYDLIFSPAISTGPMIMQTSANALGNNKLTIQISKCVWYY